MRRLAAIVVIMAAAVAAQAPTLDDTLSFEAGVAGSPPSGWEQITGTVVVDSKIVHGGHGSARFEPGAASKTASIQKTIPVNVTGKTIQLRGFIRTENLDGRARLTLEENDSSGRLAWTYLFRDAPTGTTPWREYSVNVPVHPDARTLSFGANAEGHGKAWFDDLRLLVDGMPMENAPHVKRPLEDDHEFDKGSRITLTTLSPTQIANLATLAKVWGFLKYHHPKITSGERHWDYDLLRVMPAILAAQDSAAANDAMEKWVDSLGPVTPCKPCARLRQDDLQLAPDIDWITNDRITNTGALGSSLSRKLADIYANRSAGVQFYIGTDMVGRLWTLNELEYVNTRGADTGFRLLALFRLWNMVQYWSPNRTLTDTQWDDVLTRSIPELALAKDYIQRLTVLVGKVNDSHATLVNADGRPPFGSCRLPANLRFINEEAVVTGFYPTPEAFAESGLQRGDVMVRLDGVTVAGMIGVWAHYYGASNRATMLRNLSSTLSRGECGKPREVEVRRGAASLNLTVQPAKLGVASSAGVFSHDLPGANFQLLAPKIAYFKFAGIKEHDIATGLQAAMNTSGMILDLRDYPTFGAIQEMGGHLIDRETHYAQFSAADVSNPGAFHWKNPDSIKPLQPRYKGKVVILVDETTQSYAELHAMAFRAASGAVVIGSTTAGADGPVYSVALPGGIQAHLTGMGVFYPDKRPTQRVGIVPDRVVIPTIDGIRDGRDELLEAGVREILGAQAEIPDSRKFVAQ